MDVKNNENPKICKSCGGRCCQNAGCSITAEDFQKFYGEINPDSIKKVLDNGFVTLTYRSAQRYEDVGYECINSVYFLYYLKMRARHADKFGFTFPDNGPCRMWSSDKGCKFSWDKRPSGGKVLVPKWSSDWGYECHILESLKDEGIEDDVDLAIKSWIPYQSTLNEVANEFYSKGYEPDILEMFPEYHDA